MGLRKITQNDETSYMFSNISIPDEVLIILLRNNVAFSVQLKTDSDAVKKWCRNLQKSPEEYMTLMHKAVETCLVTYTDEEEIDKNEDVFEIQEDCLVWKQYFPDKNVYGRRGKFTLDTITYEEAVKEVLEGTIGDLGSKSSSIQKLTGNLDKKSKELQRAKELTSKSITEKETFEKEVYGKCISIINAKKLKIRQLMSGSPSTSGAQPVVRKVLTSTQASSSASKNSKSKDNESDGYSSDTDVDDPEADDVDTDEENTRKTEEQKRKADHKPKAKPKRLVVNDSQDDMFNDSLEAELYPTNSLTKKQKIADNNGKTGKSSGLKASNGKGAVEDVKSGSHSSFRSLGSDSQRSIIDELF